MMRCFRLGRRSVPPATYIGLSKRPYRVTASSGEDAAWKSKPSILSMAQTSAPRCSAKAARTRSGVKGMRLSRIPTASWMAFAMAGMIG